jgi:hydroxyethylthiazole kinase-like uncharacterized protein yjeF
MKKVYYEVGSLDKRCYEEFFLSEDLLMENAALALVNQIRKTIPLGSNILFLCGPGNNGADGIASARILDKEYEVSLFLPLGVKSQMAKLQLKRAQALHVNIKETIEKVDCIVDCLFGSGLKKELSEEILLLLKKINEQEAYKIACDIPTGINIEGKVDKVVFKADATVTMGAFKEALFSDDAKEYVGEILVAKLGLNEKNYEKETTCYLLEQEDMNLPFREEKNTHKGDFGHTCVLCGQKSGASILSGTAAFNFGSGLVSLVTRGQECLPPFLMQTAHLPASCSVVVAGMGLGDMEDELLYEYLLGHPHPLVIDADLFYQKITLEIIKQKEEVVLTPHPKEFCALLQLCGIAKISVKELQANRFYYVREFSKKYPKAVLLLKGANTIITHNQNVYINTLGSQRLSKGGSGDVLAGLIGSLVAQKYTLLDATISASLAHVCAANMSKSANYALNPLDICEGVKWLQKK